MTNEDKELLLKDICTRLPYFLKVNIKGSVEVLNSWSDDDGNYFNFLSDGPECNFGEGFTLDDIKPYLRPMSSMTEEEEIEYHNLCYEDEIEVFEFGEWVTKTRFHNTIDSIDYLNAHYFDYRGLIPMGLAIEATEEMYN